MSKVHDAEVHIIIKMLWILNGNKLSLDILLLCDEYVKAERLFNKTTRMCFL